MNFALSHAAKREVLVDLVGARLIRAAAHLVSKAFDLDDRLIELVQRRRRRRLGGGAGFAAGPGALARAIANTKPTAMTEVRIRDRA